MIDEYIGGCHGMPIKDMRESSRLFKPTNKLFLYILISLIFIYSVTGLSFIYPDHDINESYHIACNTDCGTQVTYNSTYFEWETNITNYNYSRLYLDSADYGSEIIYSNNTIISNSLLIDLGLGSNVLYVNLFDENNSLLYQINSSYIINISEFGSCPSFYLNSGSYSVNYYWNNSFNDTISDDGGSNISYCEVHIYPTTPFSIIAYNGSLGYFEYQPVIQDFIDEGYQMLNCSLLPDLGFGCFAVDPYCYDTDGYCNRLHDIDIPGFLLIINTTCMPTMTNYTQCSDITDENICILFSINGYCSWNYDTSICDENLGFQNISCQTANEGGFDGCYYNASGCFYADQQVIPPENESNENQTNITSICSNCTTHSINDVTLHISDYSTILIILVILFFFLMIMSYKSIDYIILKSVAGATLCAISIIIFFMMQNTNEYIIAIIVKIFSGVITLLGFFFIYDGLSDLFKYKNDRR